MNKIEEAIETLNKALEVKFHSLERYALKANPYAESGDLAQVEALERIEAENESLAREIAAEIEALDGVPHAGFPDPIVSDATAVILSQSVFASAVGAVIACARARDDSIWLPIAVHAGFDFVALAAAGSVGGVLEDTPANVLRLLIPG